MSPDLLLWLAFALKIIATTVFVVARSLITERAGALVGALVVTLPASAGPAYVLLAMDYDAYFIAAAAMRLGHGRGQHCVLLGLCCSRTAAWNRC